MKYINDVKKILAILMPKERRQIAILFILMIIGMLFEMIGVAIVIPFVNLLGRDNYAEKLYQLAPFLEKIGNNNQANLIIIVILFFTGFYVIKNSYLVFSAWKQSRISSTILANLSTRLFELYLRQPYTFHLQHNSAQLIRNTVNEVGAFGMYGLNASLLLVTESFVIFGIIMLLMCIEPLGTTITILIIGLTACAYYFFTKNSILKWGKARQLYEGMKIKHIQQGLGGAKMVKLIGCERYFIDQYRFNASAGAQVGQRQNFAGQVPKFLLETVAVISMGVLVVAIVIKDNSTENIMPVISLFAMSGFRLLPSVNRIVMAMQSLKYGIPVINLLYGDLINLQVIKATKDTMSVNFMENLEINKVSYSYPNNDKKVLQNIALTIKKGETIGVIGESGAGKSTLVDIILGLFIPSSGEVLVDKVNIHNDINAWRKQIGYVPQSIYLTDDSLRRNVAFGLKDEEIDDDNVWHVLKIAQLDGFIKKLPEGLETFVGERGVRLSGGQQQRIGIARAMYHNPSLLLLDEATSALDNETESNFMKTIEALHGTKTVIIIAHRLSTVQNCDRIYRIKDGRIVDHGSPMDILN